MMRLVFAALAMSLTLAAAVRAEPLASPEGPVLVTVTGEIGRTNADGEARFDLAMLEALPGRETTSDTPWFDGPRSFEGPLLSALLEAVGARGRTLRVIALNDYAAEIPVEDVEAHPVILAVRMEGRLLSVRDKGPAFVIYPFDAAPELYNEMIFGRSVWQVVRIEVF